MERYVAADEFYKIGSNTVIMNNTILVTTNGGVEYNITYSNSLCNDGLIFYRFNRIGKPKEEPEPSTAPSTVPSWAKDNAVSKVTNWGDGTDSDVVVNWGEVIALVSIAELIVATTGHSDSVQETLAAYARIFLTKLGTALAKVAAGGVAVGVFANSSTVMAAEQNPESADLHAVNEAVYEFETALETLLGIDSIDEFLTAISGIDQDELADMIKGIQDENDEYEEASEAQPPRDPLIIDFGTAGIDLCSLAEGVNFDLDNNGFAEKTAWIGTEDGFLALDRIS